MIIDVKWKTQILNYIKIEVQNEFIRSNQQFAFRVVIPVLAPPQRPDKRCSLFILGQTAYTKFTRDGESFRLLKGIEGGR